MNQLKLDANTCSSREAREIHLSVPFSALNGYPVSQGLIKRNQ